MVFTVLFLTGFVGVALKAFSQLNVQHDRYLWIPPVSYGMAFCEVVGITQVLTGYVQEASPMLMALALGTGAWMGCMSSMTLHRRMRGQ